MHSTFESLQKTVEQLNNAGDRANDLIRATNDRLREMGVGVEYWPSGATLRTETVSLGVFTDYRLGYGKVEGAWQLAVRVEAHDCNFDPSADLPEGSFVSSINHAPLLSADRELRIRAASTLRDFLQLYNEHLAKLAAGLPGVHEDQG